MAHQRLPVGRVAANPGMQVSKMDGVIVPVLHGDQHQRGAVTNDDLGIAGPDGSRAPMSAARGSLGRWRRCR